MNDRYQLYHGDCLDILPTLEAGSIDAVITDPPYGTTACKWDSVIPLEPMWAGIKHVLKPRGAAVLFGSQPFTSALVMSNVDWFREYLAWDKVVPSGMSYARFQHMRQVEDIVIFSGSFGIYNPQKTKRAKPIKEGGKTKSESAPIKYFNSMGGKIYNEKMPVNLIRFKKVRNNSAHPTQKPVALMEYLIKTYTNEGDTVLDFTMGSGSTGVAAMNTGRRFVGIELDAEYYAIAEQRIKNAAGEFVRTDKEKEAGQLALFGD